MKTDSSNQISDAFEKLNSHLQTQLKQHKLAFEAPLDEFYDEVFKVLPRITNDSPKDLLEYYHSKQTMYSRVEDAFICANQELLKEVLKDIWQHTRYILENY